MRPAGLGCGVARHGGTSRGQLLRAIQRGPYLILAGVFPLEAFATSFPAQPMVQMTQILPFTFGGLVHHPCHSGTICRGATVEPDRNRWSRTETIFAQLRL